MQVKSNSTSITFGYALTNSGNVTRIYPIVVEITETSNHGFYLYTLNEDGRKSQEVYVDLELLADGELQLAFWGRQHAERGITLFRLRVPQVKEEDAGQEIEIPF